MSSLADELLNDLEDDPTDEQEQEEAPPQVNNPLKRKVEGDDVDMSADEDEDEEKPTLENGIAPGGIAPAQELDEEEVEKMDMGAVEDVRNVAKLEGSKRMVEILQVSSQSKRKTFN